MQTSKFLFFIGLMAALVSPARTCVARDTEEQIKAREALRQKIAELNPPPATTPTPVAPEPPPAPAKPAKPADPVTTPRKKAPVVPVAPVPAPAPATVIPSSSIFAPVPDAVEDANASRAREALRQLTAVSESTPAIATKPKKSIHAPVFTEPVVAAATVLVTPLFPLTGSKPARLAELLQRYNADLVTPKEYHTQRATILAEP